MISAISNRLVTCFVSLVFIAIGAQPARCLIGQGPDLPNFGQVTDGLYRGGQPTSNGFSKLKAMGVGLVINFREEPAEIALEKRQVGSLGMEYIGIPWNAHHELSSADVEEFLEIIRDHPKTKVFVHCKRGADRTGLMVAVYRIAVEHKEVADAISEMHQFHFAGFSHPQLTHYIKALPGLIENDPAFKIWAPAQVPVGSGRGKTN